MASSTRRDLYLAVSGNVDGLTAAMKAGRSVLNEFGVAADNTAEEVKKAFANLGGASVETSARSIEAAYGRTFEAIRKNARSVLDAPTGAGAVQVINASAAREAADVAERQAMGLRLVADAAGRAAAANRDDATATRVYATAAEAAAIGAEQEAKALRAQVGVLEAVEGQLTRTGAAQRRQTVLTSQQRAATQQLGFQLNDVAVGFAAGTPPMVIFAQQSGQVIQALGLMTDGAKGFLGFLGGPWGIALTSALIVLTPFVAKLFEESDAAKAAKKASDEHKNAIEDLIEAQSRAVTSTEEKLKRDRDELDAERRKTIAIRETTAALLEQAKAKLQSDLSTSRQGGERSDLAAARLSGDSNEITRLEGELAKNSGEIARLTTATTQAAGQYIKSVVAASSTPEGRTNRRFDRLEQQAQRELDASKDFAAYRATMNRLTDARAAELKAIQTAKTKPKATNVQSGREISLADARAIVASVGGTVSSGLRSKAEQQVLYDRYLAGKGPLAAKPGTSDHELGHAVDVPKKVGLTLDKLVAAFQAQGVRVTQKLDEGSHYHVAFGSKTRTGEAAAAQAAEAGFQLKPIDFDAFLSPSGRADAAKRAGAQARDSFVAVFGEDDPLGPLIAEYNDELQNVVSERTAVLETALDRPLGRYREQLQEAVGDTDLALEGVAERGFASLEDGFVDVIAGTESVGGAFKRMAQSIIADLARIAIQKAILSALPGVGSFLGFAKGGEVKGYAGGGLISGAGTGTSDDILSWLSNGEFVMTAAATRRYLPMLKAMNDNQLPAFAAGGLVGSVPALPNVGRAANDVYAARRQDRIAVDARVQVEAGPMFDARVQSVAAQTVGLAAEPIMAGAEDRTMKRLSRPSLPGGWG